MLTFLTQSTVKKKNNKAAGIDEITGEMLKAGGQRMINCLLRICTAVWRTEKVPDDWKNGIIIRMPKKGDPPICRNNCGITLLSIAGKIQSSVL